MLPLLAAFTVLNASRLEVNAYDRNKVIFKHAYVHAHICIHTQFTVKDYTNYIRNYKNEFKSLYKISNLLFKR